MNWDFRVKIRSRMVDRVMRDDCMKNDEACNTSECPLMDDESR